MDLESFVKGVKLITGEENPSWFMQAEHDTIYVGTVGTVDPTLTEEQKHELDALGFCWDSGDDCWYMFT